MVLVVISLILLTDYFGESPSSPLHTLQRGIAEVFSPIQQGASTVLSPIRDIGNWFSDTFKAKGQVAQLQAEVHRLQGEVARAQYAESRNAQLQHLVGLDQTNGISAYHPVAADIYSRDGSLWYQTMTVDEGSDNGVRLNDPVIGDRGLVGEVTVVGSTYSVVRLITAPGMAVAAQVGTGTGNSGVLQPAVGDPNQLTLTQLPANAQNIKSGDLVVTVGFKSGKLQDLYPAGIPVGVVSPSFNPDTLASSGDIPVTPVVDLLHLSAVQILTAPHAGDERAQLP